MAGIFPKTRVLWKPLLVICSFCCLSTFPELQCWATCGPLSPLSPTSPVLRRGLILAALCSVIMTWGSAFTCKEVR